MVDQNNEHQSNNIASRRSMKGIAITLIVMVLIIILLWFWRSSRQNSWQYNAGGPIDVIAVRLDATSVAEKMDALGNIRAVSEVTLASETTGRVVDIRFDSGRQVKAGEIIVQLDDAPEKADLASAQAAAAFAQQQYSRVSKLAASGAVSVEALQQRLSERDQAAARVMQLEARIRQKSIRAPFDGQLGLRQVDPGQYLNSGDPIATLTDLHAMYVDFSLPQQSLGRLQIGQRVDVSVDETGTEASAQIAAIEPQVSSDTRNVNIRARLNSVTPTLRPGMYVSASVRLPDTPDALMLPSSAIMTSSSGDAVILVRGDKPEVGGKAEYMPVTAGRRVGDKILITRGLKAGDVVVSEGQLRIQPGAEVKVVAPAATHKE